MTAGRETPGSRAARHSLTEVDRTEPTRTNHMKNLTRAAVICVIAALAPLAMTGCASSIDRSSDIRTQRLEVGHATKDDVVRAIGLPRKVVADAQAGLESWFYVGEADFSSAFVPVPIYIGRSYSAAILVSVGAATAPKDATFVAVFDKSARLVDIQYPQPAKPQ